MYYGNAVDTIISVFSKETVLETFTIPSLISPNRRRIGVSFDDLLSLPKF